VSVCALALRKAERGVRTSLELERARDVFSDERFGLECSRG